MCRAPNLRNIVGGTSPTSVASLQNLQLTKTAAGDAETAFEVQSDRVEFDVDLRVPSPSGDGKSSIELVLRHTAAVAHGKWFAVGRRHEELVEAMWLPVETPAAAPAGHSTKALHARLRRPRADCRLGSRARRRARPPLALLESTRYFPDIQNPEFSGIKLHTLLP